MADLKLVSLGGRRIQLKIVSTYRHIIQAALLFKRFHDSLFMCITKRVLNADYLCQALGCALEKE